MAVAEVEKVEILVHSSRRLKLLSAIQEAGIVQVEEAPFEDLNLDSLPPDLSRHDHALFRLKHALQVFSEFDETKGLKRLLMQKPGISPNGRDEILSFDYLSVLKELEKAEDEKSDLLSEIRLLDKEEGFLIPWADLDVPLGSLKPTATTEIILGALPSSETERLDAMASESTLWYKKISDDSKTAYIFMLCHRDEKEDIETSLREIKFNALSFEPVMRLADPAGTVRDLLQIIEKKKSEKSVEIGSRDGRIRELARHNSQLMSVHDVLFNEREKILTSSLLGNTESVSYLHGWIPASRKDALKKKLDAFSKDSQIYIRPPLPEEEPPVILDNPSSAKPFEILTGLYGLPEKGYMDPTRPLAPFFVIYVGLMVTEAGYGLLASLLALFFLKSAKPKGGTRQFMRLLLILGVANMVLGTFFGGWFGFPIRKLLLIDSMQNPIAFLALALGLGFVQILFAIFLSILHDLKNKNYVHAILVQGGWLLLLPSLVGYLVLKKPVFGILALIGAGGIVLFGAPSRNPVARVLGGLYSLYDISSYMSDTLSYSRILALGLATGVIAMVVNNLCATALRIPVAGWIMAPLIFVVGHLLNMGIGFLGGFVHSMRLQFVEFFRRFYKAGGRPFEPFRLEGQYVEFNENLSDVK